MESSSVLFSLHQPGSRSLTSVRLLFTIKFVHLRWVGLLRRTVGGHFQDLWFGDEARLAVDSATL